jgi:CheY-like chemotaxis protein
MLDDRQRCIDAGMEDFVAKPIEPDELLTVLAACLLRGENDRVASERTSETEVDRQA